MKLLTDQECLNGMNRICDSAKSIASDSGIRLQLVQIDDGKQMICKSTHCLKISARGKTVTATITHADIAGFEIHPHQTQAKIRAAVEKLLVLLKL